MTTIQSSFDNTHSSDMNAKIVCELCEKIFPNRVLKSNHKLLVHTVRAEFLKCDYCSEDFEGLKKLCKHISHDHRELFPKRRGNQCYICS